MDIKYVIANLFLAAISAYFLFLGLDPEVTVEKSRMALSSSLFVGLSTVVLALVCAGVYIKEKSE